MHPRTSRATTASAARSSRRHRLRRESPPLQYDRLDLVERSEEILPTDVARQNQDDYTAAGANAAAAALLFEVFLGGYVFMKVTL
jgi:hypothetical protein